MLKRTLIMDRRYQKSTGVIYEIPALQITIVRTGGLGSGKSVRYYVKHMRQSQRSASAY